MYNGKTIAMYFYVYVHILYIIPPSNIANEVLLPGRPSPGVQEVPVHRVHRPDPGHLSFLVRLTIPACLAALVVPASTTLMMTPHMTQWWAEPVCSISQHNEAS